MSKVYELETVDNLPAKLRALVPLPSKRYRVRVGDFVRLFVYVNGSEATIAPWVAVVEVTAKGYVGEVGGVMNSPDWHPYGTRVAFTFDNIIAL